MCTSSGSTYMYVTGSNVHTTVGSLQSSQTYRLTKQSLGFRHEDHLVCLDRWVVALEVGYTIIMSAFREEALRPTRTKRLVRCKHADRNAPADTGLVASC
jgi:hypothetical protein